MAASLDDMADFVDWDEAGPAAFDDAFGPADADNIGLVLANVNEDDFGLCALQQFAVAGDGAVDLLMDGTAALDLHDRGASPCDHCALGGYACKRIREGRHSGYCTSCVALRVECSLANGALAANPWPTMTNPEQLGDSSAAAPTRALHVPPAEDGGVSAPRPGPPPPKIGARFSRESDRILKNWFSSHNRHPYPSDEEKEALQRQTGLNKTQITNWLANARRRGKVQPPRSTSPHVGSWSGSGAVDIPLRPGTPALEAMNPLQRWQHSPPENEAASVTAIARAVTASSPSSGLDSPYSFNYTDDGSGRSVCNQSSTSSLGTSHSSNGSRGSAYSHGSRNSWESFGSAAFSARGRRRRRRRATPNNAPGSRQGAAAAAALAAPLKTFQCTFCTETFRTKHDWQRHEKSLHLSLERWVCAPSGPRAVHPDSGQLSCAFCGLTNPDDAHVEAHNHSACQERTLEERTFYRKDHLNQHLRLVHNAKFANWSMKQWKVATPEIRSRCGFCGIVMDTWTIRVDHLAEHFKTGCSMADWKGDWGFDAPILDIVENSIPPYLIHHERASPFPFEASQAPPETPRNAYELIKLELAYFGANHWEHHQRAPTDEEMQLEGCRIIFASELLSLQGVATQASWFRDLIMSSDEVAQRARFGPLRGAAENRLATLKINGKDNLFEECPMERQLQDFVKAKQLLGLTTMDDELQEEARKIVGRVEEVCTHPSESVANWLLRLVTRSTGWLADFRRRAHLPRSEDVQDKEVRSTDPKSIDSTIHSYSRLECELSDFLKLRRSMGVEPTDEDLQKQARIIIYEFDDGWNQTAADSLQWLEAFKQRYPREQETSRGGGADTPMTGGHGVAQSSAEASPSVRLAAQQPWAQAAGSGGDSYDSAKPSRGRSTATPFFLNDANCYLRLAKELRRWVKSAMSPKNPQQHVPTDEELQYQARWILYDDDDPWNQTAADNVEWLQRFKRDVGIIREPGPGLPGGYAWALEQGGSGFAPPYAFPKGHVEPCNKDMQVNMRQGAKTFTAGQAAVNGFLEKLTSESCRPASVFCSRELEKGLAELVEKSVGSSGRLPADGAMRAKARELVGAPQTAADDAVLLGTFKERMRERLPHALPAAEGEADAAWRPAAKTDVDAWDEALGSMLQDMDFDFTADGTGTAMLEETEEAGGARLDSWMGWA